MEHKIKLLRIIIKDNNRVFNVVKNVDKETALKQLRELDSKRIITSDYAFLDGDDLIDEDIEEEYIVEDLLLGEKPFIYIRQKHSNKRIIQTMIDMKIWEKEYPFKLLEDSILQLDFQTLNRNELEQLKIIIFKIKNDINKTSLYLKFCEKITKLEDFTDILWFILGI